MGYRRDNNRRPNNNFGGPRETFKAKCSDCGNDCDVPFQPTQGKPVYCRDCFKNHRKPAY